LGVLDERMSVELHYPEIVGWGVALFDFKDDGKLVANSTCCSARDAAGRRQSRYRAKRTLCGAPLPQRSGVLATITTQLTG